MDSLAATAKRKVKPMGGFPKVADSEQRKACVSLNTSSKKSIDCGRDVNLKDMLDVPD